jgi:predicted metalloprotease
MSILTVILALVFGVNPQQLQQKLPGGGGGGGGKERELTAAEKKYKQFAGVVLGYTEDVWEDLFPKNFRKPYEKPMMALFEEQAVTGGCGNAPSAVGPFYCPADKTVYLDPTFFDELEKKLGGSKAEFSQAYVIAHEVGHHVQNLLGYNSLVERYRKQEGENAGIRLELQADYLAGVWAHHADKKKKILERGDVDSAITTARAIGDNRIQEKTRGWASPESFNHGTDKQRIKYFNLGLQSGDASKATLDRFFDQNVRPLDL